jgi:hypothetical protein
MVCLLLSKKQKNTAAKPSNFKNRGFTFVPHNLWDAKFKMLKHGNIFKEHAFLNLSTSTLKPIVKKWQGLMKSGVLLKARHSIAQPSLKFSFSPSA